MDQNEPGHLLARRLHREHLARHHDSAHQTLWRGQQHRAETGRKVTITRLVAAPRGEVAAMTASSAANNADNPMRHFARQLRKARLARGWTVREAGRQLGYDDAQVSRVENGNRPPTESFARACDRVWPERDGWFLDYYTESREWLATPPWFRPWLPIEAAATELKVIRAQAWSAPESLNVIRRIRDEHRQRVA